MNENLDISADAEAMVFTPLAEEKKKCSCKKGNATCTCAKGGCCGRRAAKLDVYDWLADLPESQDATKMVEVQFKNTRKGYYINSNDIALNVGDMVAVEASPGHDIGHVTLIGKLVLLQMRKNNIRPQQGEQKRIYRVAKPVDIEKYEAAKALEHSTMIRSREIAENLQLQMKIGDVEYQGDGNKAIFYYIADERVDFRQLIKVLAEEFHVRIEMKQIGARQEAGRIGGIGPCGRQLCCSSWMGNFVSVSTSAARFQDISLNPQKLAGQCGKLKCCLNYEIDQYVEARKQLPSAEMVLETQDGHFFHFKTDVFSGQMTYSSSRTVAANLVTIPKERVFEIIQMNKQGVKPANLNEEETEAQPKRGYEDVLEQDSITRFDSTKRKKKRPTGQSERRGERTQGENRNRNVENTRQTDANAPKDGSRRIELRRESRPQRQNQQTEQNTQPATGEGSQQPNNNRNRPRGNNERRPNNNRNGGPRKEIRRGNDKPAEN